MGLLFESILLFSLAVLIILVGMLVYYFKKRIVDIEQKNAKCFEIVQDVYMQQMQLKKEVFAVLFRQQEEVFTQTHHLQEDHRGINKERIHVELSESDDESDDDESVDDESDDESADNESSHDNSCIDDSCIDDSCNDNSCNDDSCQKIKIVNVDLSYPEECDISIDEEIESEDEIVDEPETGVVSLNNPEIIVVNKVEDTKKPVSKEELQKMSPASLKSLIISKGGNAETVNKMKKKELVDMLI